MCGHGSNPGPGHPRPAAVNRTDPDQGRRRTHTSPERAPHVWSILQVVRSGPQPSGFAPDAARTIPARSPKVRTGGRDPSRLRYTSATSNWTSWNRPGRGRRGCGRSAGRQGAALMGRGRVEVVESLTFSGEDNRRRPAHRVRSTVAATMPAAPALPVRHCIHDDRPPAPILHFHCPNDWNMCRHNITLNNGLFVVHVVKEESRVTAQGRRGISIVQNWQGVRRWGGYNNTDGCGPMYGAPPLSGHGWPHQPVRRPVRGQLSGRTRPVDHEFPVGGMTMMARTGSPDPRPDPMVQVASDLGLSRGTADVLRLLFWLPLASADDIAGILSRSVSSVLKALRCLSAAGPSGGVGPTGVHHAPAPALAPRRRVPGSDRPVRRHLA